MAICEVDLGPVPRALLDPVWPADVYVALVSLAIRLDQIKPQFPRLIVLPHFEKQSKETRDILEPLYGFASIERVDPKAMIVRAEGIFDDETQAPLGVNLQLIIDQNRRSNLAAIETIVVNAICRAL